MLRLRFGAGNYHNGNDRQIAAKLQVDTVGLSPRI
jgi:hypothetical protein